MNGRLISLIFFVPVLSGSLCFAEHNFVEPGYVEFEPIREAYVEDLISSISAGTRLTTPLRLQEKAPKELEQIWRGNKPKLVTEIKKYPRVVFLKETDAGKSVFEVSFDFWDRFGTVVKSSRPKTYKLQGGMRLQGSSKEPLIGYLEGEGDTSLVLALPGGYSKDNETVFICPRKFIREPVSSGPTPPFAFWDTGYDVSEIIVEIDGAAGGYLNSSIDPALARAEVRVSAGLARGAEFEDEVFDTNPTVAINYVPNDTKLSAPPFSGEFSSGIISIVQLKTAAGYVRRSSSLHRFVVKRIWFDKPLKIIRQGSPFEVKPGNCFIVVYEHATEDKYWVEDKKD